MPKGYRKDGSKLGFQKGYRKGYHLSEETKRRLSLIHFGVSNPKHSESLKKLYKEGIISSWNKGLTKHTDERIKRQSEKLKGIKRSEKTRLKISNTRKQRIKEGKIIHPNGMLGKHFSEETRRKMSLKKKNIPKSYEHKLNMSLSKKEFYKNNPNTKVGFQKGHIISEEHKNKLRILTSIRLKGKHTKMEWKKNDPRILRENNGRWLGGISFEPYTQEFRRKELREQIRVRDNFTCQLCGLEQNGHKLDIHHIDYDKKNCSLENLISLCRICHAKTQINRIYWTNYFQNFLGSKYFVFKEK